MSKFEDSQWNNNKYAQEFIENADFYILERRRLFKIMKSLYKHFIMDKIKNKRVKVLDIGCGDGILTYELLKIDETLEATLVDGSAEMLANAKKRLKNYSDLDYIQITFQNFIKKGISKDFDFIISSLAIHHLQLEQKENLFQHVYNRLNEGGFFVNIDVVHAPNEELNGWYLKLWKEWIIEKETENEDFGDFQHIPDQYRNNSDNHPDTLKKQLNLLESIGFKNVDCYYKYGIFAIYGGTKDK